MKWQISEQMITAACKAARENFEASTRRLAEAAAEFQRRIDMRAPSKSSRAAEIVALAKGADWPRVYPQGLFELAPWLGDRERIAFNPADWREVDASMFRHALEQHHRAFLALQAMYRQALRDLSEPHLRELFPDGQPRL